MEKSVIEEGMKGKALVEMNKHELAVASANAIDRVKSARDKLDQASVDQKALAALEVLNAGIDLSLVNQAQVALLSAGAF